MASSSLWTIYSMINSVTKGKYSFNLKQYCRVTILLKSFEIDIKQKAPVTSNSFFWMLILLLLIGLLERQLFAWLIMVD